ncbi:hypothetical protein D9M68_393780 [compost metagenome]
MGERSQSVGLLDLKRGRHLPGRPVGKADVTNLAGANDRIECQQRFLERRVWIFLVDDVGVDPVGAETLQALVDRPEDVVARKAGLGQWRSGAKAHFRGDHDFITAGA